MGCLNGWKWRESHRGGGVSAVKSCYATPFFCGWRIASVKNGERKKKKKSFAISARCPEGAGLPQSRRSVLLSPACVLLSRRCDSGTHTAILIVSAWSRRADSDALTLPACALMFTGTDQPSQIEPGWGCCCCIPPRLLP